MVPTPLLSPENDYGPLGGALLETPELRVTVVIPVYNRVDLLARTIAGARTQRYPRDLIRLVVADDGSEEDVASAVKALTVDFPVSVLRREHEGYGAGQARNLGAASADDGDILVFFDSDCVPDPDAVARHSAWHHAASNLVVIGSRHHVDTTDIGPEIIEEDPEVLRRLALGERADDASAWVSPDFRATLHRRTASLRHGDQAFRSLVSSNFSVPAAAFEEVGGFSEDFTRWGGEDTELGWRLWNAGMFFVDEPGAAIYHQQQTDAGPEGWRQVGRSGNDGLIQTKIPHRFYRTPVNTINEAPKVSVIVHHPEDSHLEGLADQVLGQRIGDVEMVVVTSDIDLHGFSERRHGDPRFRFVSRAEDGVVGSRAEFVALLSGAAALDHRLLSRSVAALERRPRLGHVRAAYGVRQEGGADTYRRQDDLAAIDRDWGQGLPVFGMTRRRDLAKALRSGHDLSRAWDWVETHTEGTSHGTPLVWIPSATRTPVLATHAPPKPRRSEVLDDLRSGGSKAVKAPIRATLSVVTGRPYRRTAPRPAPSLSATPGPRPAIRYVGWTGRSNMGDEAMLQAVTDLFDWGDVTTGGDGGDLLMLGGGTLINRGYLRHLRPLDSPQRERVAFGPGVANPIYWGDPKERPEEWVAFLESCAYVGVRGPISARLLDDWGMRSTVEVVGDPALSLIPSPGIEPVEGRIVVCPAWARGLLWGESDDTVLSAFARSTRRLLDDGHDVWAMSAFPADDRWIIAMMREAGAPDLPYLAVHDEPQAAMDLLASAELVVAERLHAAVLAAAAGSLPVMVEYRPKLRDFAASVGLENLCLRTDAVGGGALETLVSDAYGSRAELGPGVTEAVERYRALQRSAADRIHRIYAG